MIEAIKLWHDDNRFPPDDSWEWAKTNDEAIAYLSDGNVQFISMDMDLGAVEGKDFNYGREAGRMYRGATCREVDWLRNMNNDGGENGAELCAWMVERGIIPARIVIHTWNSWGSKAMLDCFSAGGYTHPEYIFWSGNLDHLARVYGSEAIA